MNTVVSDFHPASEIRTSQRVMLLLADGVSLTTVSSTLEPFQQANRVLRRHAFDLKLVSLHDKDPVTSAGIPIPCTGSASDALLPGSVSIRPDLVILCCGQSMDESSQRRLERFVRSLYQTAVPFFALGAACEVVASFGRAKNGKCAAHWKAIASMEERYPHLEFQNVLFASDGTVTSCAGELAAFDLIVDFIDRTCGARVGAEICSHFLASGKRSGEMHQVLNADAALCSDSRFQQALDIMIDNIETPISTAELARRLGLSCRQVERIFAKNGFKSPLKYYTRLRLNRARQLLEQTRMSLTEVAIACGYESPSSFSKNYKRVFGKTPRSCRRGTARC